MNNLKRNEQKILIDICHNKSSTKLPEKEKKKKLFFDLIGVHLSIIEQSHMDMLTEE